MRGPPPKPTYLRILEGNPSKRPLNRNEPQPPPVETLDPPDYLGGHAATEWCRIVPGLSAMRLLTIADIRARRVLRRLCALARGEEALARFRAGDPVTRGLLVDGRVNPLVGIARNAARDMLRQPSVGKRASALLR